MNPILGRLRDTNVLLKREKKNKKKRKKKKKEKWKRRGRKGGKENSAVKRGVTRDIPPGSRGKQAEK